MAPLSMLMVLLAVATIPGTWSDSQENELDYGYWNYREGADRVNVTSVRSVTRVLDAWGKRIFNEIKTLLHSQPNTILPDYSRVRPLSESLNDLFREVSLLRKRITELSHRLETLEPFLRHYGYRGTKEGAAGEGGHGGEEVVAAGYQSPRPGAKGSRVVGRRRVRVLRNGGVRLLQRVRDSQ
ncbi:uncharacterized protein LOC142898066 [Nelusetta ayraudi]|uniref:uncharacterized protein LOC142898066 n=1 Tax=Nelusetta ayraudi TaxID=303726 RepID=UPI003F70ED28